ncbi:MAG TPA: ATP-binding protein [Propionicimonas sp.]|jgi:SpoVK/Ycf46/Vps4 family AAA+-type ATPase
MIAEERGKQHHVLADRLAEYLNGPASMEPRTSGLRDQLTDQTVRLLHEVQPHRRVEDLILPADVVASFNELVEEQSRADLLRAYGLEPRHRILLVGPPGNGKTSLAEALAEALSLSMYVVRYEGVIGSYLGETAVRLRQVFDFVRTRPCVLFLDEFDTLGKERGDPHDTGEVKRVVSSLLLQIDDLPSHVVVVTATNHAELLDRAVWRRFEVCLNLPAPGLEEVMEWLQRLEQRIGEPLGRLATEMPNRLLGLSYSDLELIALDLQRQRILRAGSVPFEQIVRDRIDHATRRAGPWSQDD